MMTTRRRLVSVLLSFHHIIILSCFINLHTCDTSCQFPAEWTGKWFERDETEYVRIQNGTISTKGLCVRHEPHNNKYILRDPERRCYMCVVIHQKHINLLQYKQSFCQTRFSSLTELCSYITGDNPLLSTFRVDAEPVPCPFTGHYTLTYNRGQKDCTSPKSTIDPCTDPSRLQYRFQACYDVPRSQSSEEELECLATWREGPDKYVVGKMHRRVAKTDNELYRCYIYSANEDNNGYEVAESADASCDGVALSPLTGARTMKLQKVHQDEISCQFPQWMSNIREWHLLNKDEKYIFRDKNMSIAIIDKLSHPEIQSTIRCVKSLASGDQRARFVVHVTVGCDNGYSCLEVFNRNRFIVQYKQGVTSRHMETACSKKFYDSSKAKYITLKAHTSKVKSEIAGRMSQAVTDIKYPTKTAVENSDKSLTMKCPYHGEYIAKNSLIRNPLKPGCNTSLMSIGCQSEYSMEIHAKCPSTSNKDRFYCHGNWTDGRTHYVIASKMDTSENYCFSYSEQENGLYFTAKQSNCREDSTSLSGNSHKILFLKKGQCSENNRASGVTSPLNLLLLLLLNVVVMTWSSSSRMMSGLIS